MHRNPTKACMARANAGAQHGIVNLSTFRLFRAEMSFGSAVSWFEATIRRCRLVRELR